MIPFVSGVYPWRSSLGSQFSPMGNACKGFSKDSKGGVPCASSSGRSLSGTQTHSLETATVYRHLTGLATCKCFIAACRHPPLLYQLVSTWYHLLVSSPSCYMFRFRFFRRSKPCNARKLRWSEFENPALRRAPRKEHDPLGDSGGGNWAPCAYVATAVLRHFLLPLNKGRHF